MARSDNPGPRYTPAQLRHIRERELGLSLKAMSAAIGYSYSTLQRYETGQSPIPAAFFIDFETLRAREAQARAEEDARRPAKPTHPEVLAEVVSLELPVELVALLHAVTGDALARRGSFPAHPPGAVDETASRTSAPLSRPPVAGSDPTLLAVLVSWPPVPLPRRMRAILWRQVYGARLLPAGGAIPLAILVSTPGPVIQHPLAMLRRRVHCRRPMLPASVPNRSTVPTRAAGTPAKNRRPGWSERAERRVLAAGLALLIVGSALVLRWSLHGNREVPVPSARKTVPDLWTGNAGESQSEVNAQRKPLKAFKGQKQSPCDPGRGEIEVDQFCWWKLDLDPTLPCPSESVRYGSKCLLPVPEGKRKSANEP